MSHAVTAMTELSPKLMMVCYQDPDYVHWGNASHYTRAIAVIGVNGGSTTAVSRRLTRRTWS